MKTILIAIALVGSSAATSPAEANSRAQSAAGSYAGCTIESGAVKCWGLVTGNYCKPGFFCPLSGNYEFSAVAMSAPLNSNIIAIAASMDAFCALRQTSVSGGDVYCWGQNSYGELGGGSTSPASSATPIHVNLGLLPGVTDLVGGGYHFCAIYGRSGSSDGNGKLVCWGASVQGQVGGGNFTASNPSPVQVQIAGVGTWPHWNMVTAGGNHTCGTVNLSGTSGGATTLECWGYNNKGQLGYGTMGTNTDTAAPPIYMPTPTNPAWSLPIDDIAGQLTSTCVVRGGHLFCWGDLAGLATWPFFCSWTGTAWSCPTLGAIPTDMEAASNMPTDTGHRSYVSLTPSPLGQHACAVTYDGVAGTYKIVCVGEDDHDELGKPMSCPTYPDGSSFPTCWQYPNTVATTTLNNGYWYAAAGYQWTMLVGTTASSYQACGTNTYGEQDNGVAGAFVPLHAMLGL